MKKLLLYYYYYYYCYYHYTTPTTTLLRIAVATNTTTITTIVIVSGVLVGCTGIAPNQSKLKRCESCARITRDRNSRRPVDTRNVLALRPSAVQSVVVIVIDIGILSVII